MSRSLRAFARLSRLKFLLGGFLGGLFGTAMAVHARGHIDAVAYLCAQLTITAFHLMTHYSNDYFDRASDVGAKRTAFSGGSGVLVDGSLPSRVALAAAVCSALVGCFGIGALLVAVHAPSAALFAATMALGAWVYSAPPIRLLARGFGELDTALVVAILVPLCAYAAQGLPLDAWAVASTLPGAAAMFAMMLAVEYPDLVADAAGGKRNLVIRFGTTSAARLGIALALAVYVGAAFAVALGAPIALALFECGSIPLALAYGRSLAAWNGPGEGDAAKLAARGVAFFIVVTCCGVLAYLTPLRT